MEAFIVFVRTDESGNIIAVNSSAFLDDTTGWTQIDEGAGDRYHHAQGNYFVKPIMTENGIYRYQMIAETPVEKTAADIEAETESYVVVPAAKEIVMQKLQAATTIKAVKDAMLEYLANA